MAMFAARNDMQSLLNNLQTSMAEESKENMSRVVHDVLQPGRPDEVFQCFIKRERTSTTSTYTLSLCLGSPDNPAIGATGTEGKFLLVARKVRGLTGTEHIICSDGNNFMRKGANVVGKLRSNILGTNFKIYESQLLHHNEAVSSNHGRSKSSTEVSPGVQAGNLKVAEVDYDQLFSNGIRRMRCTLHTIPATTIDAEGLVQPVPMAFPATRINNKNSFCSCGLLHCLQSKSTAVSDCSETDFESKRSRLLSKDEPLVLKNKPPRWHAQLRAWVLNFRGRVTMESVKNFQLVTVTKPNPTYSQTGHDGVIEPNETSSKTSHQDKALLQFGKIGKDMYTMDYRYPFSAFQAFAICLSSFDWKFFNPIDFDHRILSRLGEKKSQL